MSIITREDTERLEDADAIELTLVRMERGLQEQERRVRSAITGFSIFAVMALVISLATLIAVAVKLQAKPTTTKAASPAAPAAAVAPSNIGVALREFVV